MGCRKCGCKWFCPNPVSAIRKMTPCFHNESGSFSAGPLGVSVSSDVGEVCAECRRRDIETNALRFVRFL
jgi:hypothetical protein